jgi:hypothetical protein
LRFLELIGLGFQAASARRPDVRRRYTSSSAGARVAMPDGRTPARSIAEIASAAVRRDDLAEGDDRDAVAQALRPRRANGR